MARTKEQIAAILAKKKAAEYLKNSEWSELVAIVQAATAEQKSQLIHLLATRRDNDVGARLHDLLKMRADGKALAEVDAMLADDALSLTEIDELI